MTLALEIFAGWSLLLLIVGPFVIPALARRFARHDEWVERSRQVEHQTNRYPKIRRRICQRASIDLGGNRSTRAPARDAGAGEYRASHQSTFRISFPAR